MICDIDSLTSRYFDPASETAGLSPESAGVCDPLWLSKGDEDRKVIHIAGLGDVGRTMAIGLVLTGGDVVERIGLFDLNESQCRRMAVELGQISYPAGRKRTPDVTILPPDDPESLFSCDVFLFCATKAVPEVGSGVSDVRMAQYEANRAIVSIYAKQAAEAGFKGLFGVVSDPVELLCRAALTASKEWASLAASKERAAAECPAEENACGECTGLTPCQIQGFGMGVMYARAAYYARSMGCLSDGLRVFGMHGQELVVANSILSGLYDDELSRQLTSLAVGANKEVRSLGFKPFIAPALSSAALTVLDVIRGEWTDSSVYLGGLYFGSRNRWTSDGNVREDGSAIPDVLFARIKDAYEKLDDLAGQ